MISIFFFKEVGFIIIPVATTISSWFNAIFLFIFLKKENLFNFNLTFIDRFIKILFATILMGIFFNFLIYLFNDKLGYFEDLKALYLISIVAMGLMFYLLVAILIILI